MNDPSILPIGPPALPRAHRQPQRLPMSGRHIRVEPLDLERHAHGLFDASHGDATDALWTYMAVGPFASRAAFDAWLAPQADSDDPIAFALVEAASGTPVGMASYLRIVPAWASCEVGSIWYAPALCRTRAATEAMYLMARHVFEDLGYRRYEWKCDALNAASRRAAERLGFVYEGLFRKHMLYKGRNRDTAWYAMTDDDWPACKRAFESWLDDANFDSDGRQKQSLAARRNQQTKG